MDETSTDGRYKADEDSVPKHKFAGWAALPVHQGLRPSQETARIVGRAIYHLPRVALVGAHNVDEPEADVQPRPRSTGIGTTAVAYSSFYIPTRRRSSMRARDDAVDEIHRGEEKGLVAVPHFPIGTATRKGVYSACGAHLRETRVLGTF
uniref:Uncharacterized protein n=1 Tax=Mycena chlorophos TaxID=658473 RepID=A0ABQ0LLF3_MYCCL|nr:predicted protein [Mycena chlorophos]